MIIINPINISSKCSSGKCHWQQKKSYSIEKINEHAKRIIGKHFINLKDEEKYAKLIKKASKEHKKYGIRDKDPIKAEESLQKIKKKWKIGIRPNKVLKKRDQGYWENPIRRIHSPYVHKTVNGKFADKDLALDGLSKLIESKSISLPKEGVCLVVKGCDNNEAATKLRIYLQENKSIKTLMIATDVNPKALLIARGLDALVRSNLKKKGKKPYVQSDIVRHDAFNKNELLPRKKIKLPIIELDFRLPTIVPALEKKNTFGIEGYVIDAIKGSNICIMNFLEESDQTSDILQKTYQYEKPIEKSINSVPATFYQTEKNKEEGMYSWKKDNLRSFISNSGGDTLFLESSEAIVDSGKKIKVLSAIIKNSKKVN